MFSRNIFTEYDDVIVMQRKARYRRQAGEMCSIDNARNAVDAIGIAMDMYLTENIRSQSFDGSKRHTTEMLKGHYVILKSSIYEMDIQASG